MVSSERSLPSACRLFFTVPAAKPGPGNQVINSHGAGMKSKSKVWLGIGVFVVAGSGAVGAGAPLVLETAAVRGLQTRSATDTAIPRSAGVGVAQHADHAKADPAKADPAKAGGEGGES